jgi:uncharacterized protein (DUF2126 family)/transglutaminase-like putative cysteine protease
MAIHAALHHRTSYRYERPVSLGPQVVRLRPAPHCRTPIVSYALRIEPAEHFLNWQQDPHGNWLARIVFPKKVPLFSVEVGVVAEMAVYNPFDFFLEPGAMEWPFTYEPTAAADLEPYLQREPAGPRLEEFLGTIDRRRRGTVDFLVDLNARLAREIAYIVRLEAGVQTPEETLQAARGSCRDSAWLLVQVLRHLGLAARFASGYLIQLKPDVPALDGPTGADRDFTDLHAWCEVFLPGAGWIGLDPTSGLLAGEGHLPLACTPEPSGAAAITGTVEPSATQFDFAMEVRRIRETPRVTKPYDEETWARIDALGRVIDERLAAADVRLTMGGEPTFVSIDDMDGAEWNTAAIGPAKRRLAGALLQRLWALHGRGGFVHYGQGKWYPGESLPRWALSCWWRRDGQPIWRDPALLDPLQQPASCTVADAERFVRALSATLGVGDRHLMPGYEDAWYWLWRERRLPVNVDPLQNNLREEEERRRLAGVFERGLNQIVGYVLPLERASDGAGWVSGPWFLRSEALFLIPGDSPMGLRLPLDSQPWVAPTEFRFGHDADPMVDRPPLPAPEMLRPQTWVGRAADSAGVLPAHLRPRPQGLPPPERAPGSGESAPWIVRTALCVEPREGHLFVFLPPVRTSEDYLALLAAIEATAAQEQLVVALEGYLPPADHRLQHFKITPDPGVIEVNIHPSSTWDDLVAKTESLYRVARECRLGTEKFMLDGRHTGTGGGNHVVLGGECPSDSPFLRRPHLLRSLVAYWQRHPSLSYLFSGLFIGPSSQAPRIDEARNDALYELEIAFRELDRAGAAAPGGVPPPWLVDRVFRHLLADVTGNTHRAEFCIDKLYTPEGVAGRLGLVELRSFEMPPHARMSLAQQLLVRALVARFWEEPFVPARLVRWGTDLHDRYLLPHYVQEDFADVVAELRAWGLPMEEAWFAPHREFRFPRLGHLSVRGVDLELRHALEPWHVLGEEPAASSTVRFVDSSVERLQVKATGLVPGRHLVLCNGRRVPLQPTGVNGEYVAGVRYRAWQPASCLHPTLPVNTPLRFDLVDTWNRRAIAGCTYHVAHPGGRNYTSFPVNAYEAESRRLARFVPHGQTPGEITPPPREIAPELPHTLDLREPARVQRDE